MTAVIVGDGSDALVTPVVVNGALASITINAGGQDYTAATITFTSPLVVVYSTGHMTMLHLRRQRTRLSTQVTSILISQIGSVSNLVTTGSVNFDDGTFVLDDTNDRIGIGITPTAYKLEVGGDIYFTGGQLNWW